MTFANNLDPDEAPQNVGLHLRSKLFDIQIIYRHKKLVGNKDVLKILKETNIWKNYPACKELTTVSHLRPSNTVCRVWSENVSACGRYVPLIDIIYSEASICSKTVKHTAKNYSFLARLTKSRGSYCRTPGVCRRRPHLVKRCLQAVIISINLTIRGLFKKS